MTSNKRGGILRSVFLIIAVVMLVAAACSKSEEAPQGGEQPGGEPTELRKVTFVVGWLPGPHVAAVYAARQQGYYEEAGLDVEIIADFTTSPVLTIPTGRAEFGVSDADELLEARAQGIPLIGLLATFQTTPRILIYHEENPVDGFEDLSGRTVYVDLGDAWWEFVKGTYQTQDVQERQYNPRAFATDPDAVIQGYTGDELGIEAKFDLELGTLSLSDAGWNPYQTIFITSDSFLEENPEIVRDFISASLRGIEYYRDNYQAVDEYMQQFDTEETAPVMDAIFKLYEPLIYGGEAETLGIGYMTADRWEATLNALIQVGVLTDQIDVTEAFTTDFLPQG